jgi:hypothetical protein
MYGRFALLFFISVHWPIGNPKRDGCDFTDESSLVCRILGSAIDSVGALDNKFFHTTSERIEKPIIKWTFINPLQTVLVPVFGARRVRVSRCLN